MMQSLTDKEGTILFSPQEWNIEISREDLKTLSEHYRETDHRSAYDNLHLAIWGCGCCEEMYVELHKIKNGIESKITNTVIILIDAYRKEQVV